MKLLWSLAALASCLAAAARADEPAKPDAASVEVPYRLTVVKHILVRAKINGKGPFNFILDTGAPALFVTPEVAEKAGVKPDDKHWGQCDRFEIEGGVVVPKAKMRVEKPFQLDGMNGLGLAGVELHGMIGYNILSHYRMQIDFTKDKMVWTPLAGFDPKPPKGLGGNVNSAAGGLEVMGTLMKFFGALTGARTEPDYILRGFLGVELTDVGDNDPVVKAVLPDGPAAKSGLMAGDKITRVQGRTVTSVEDVRKSALKLEAGDEVKLTVKRGKETVDVAFKSGEGL